MGWSDECHKQRFTTAITQARQERELKRRGEDVLNRPNSGPAGFLLAAAAASAYLVWRRYEKQMAKVKWGNLPVIREFRELALGSNSSRRQARTGQTGQTSGTTSGSSIKQGKARTVPPPAMVSASGMPKAGAKPTSAPPKVAAGAAAMHRAASTSAAAASYSARTPPAPVYNPRPSAASPQQQPVELELEREDEEEELQHVSGAQAATAQPGAGQGKKKKRKHKK